MTAVIASSPMLAGATANAAPAAPATVHATSVGALAFGGGLAGTRLNGSIVGMSTTKDGAGAWLLGTDGGIFSLGDASFHGSTGNIRLNSPAQALAPTADSQGYWLVAGDGGIFSFGDAGFYGSEGGTKLNAPVIGMAAVPGHHGYWLVASDGGIFSFGSAGFFGSAGGIHLTKPIVAMAATPDGRGYWLVASDGGVFGFGDASFHGSASSQVTAPVVGVASTPDGGGYWILSADGRVFAFGNAAYLGDATTHIARNGTARAIAAGTNGHYAIAMANGAVFAYGWNPTPPPVIPPVTPPPDPSANSAAQVGMDMTQPNTVFPQGVPSSWSWYKGPEIGAGNTPPRGFTALTAWGTIYPAATGSTATNTRVELRNEETWVYSKSQGRWNEVQMAAQPTGQFYYEDLRNNTSFPASFRPEADGGASVKMEPGMALQFWPTGSRPTIDPADVGGVYTTVQTKVIVDNPALPDDTASANYIVNTGGDYWLNATAGWPNNAEIFISRFNPISSIYGSTSASTWSATQLTSNAPTFDARS